MIILSLVRMIEFLVTLVSRMAKLVTNLTSWRLSGADDEPRPEDLPLWILLSCLLGGLNTIKLPYQLILHRSLMSSFLHQDKLLLLQYLLHQSSQTMISLPYLLPLHLWYIRYSNKHLFILWLQGLKTESASQIQDML